MMFLLSDLKLRIDYNLKTKQKFTKKYLLMLNLILPQVSVYTLWKRYFERILNNRLSMYKKFFEI